MTKLQDRPVLTNENPIEVEYACNEIRKQLDTLSWLSHPYFIAQRFFKKDATTGKQFVYPETYAPKIENTGDFNNKSYHRLTADNDYSGMCFFMVGKGLNDYNANEFNFLKYKVGIIFSVNLKLIDKTKLEKGLFTQELIRESRRKLTEASILF